MEKNRIELLYRIIGIVSKVSGVPADLIVGPGQKREAADCRKIYCYAADKKLRPLFSLAEIGMPISKDHATVLFCIEQATNLAETNKLFAYNLNRVMAQLNVTDITILINEYDYIPQL